VARAISRKVQVRARMVSIAPMMDGTDHGQVHVKTVGCAGCCSNLDGGTGFLTILAEVRKLDVSTVTIDATLTSMWTGSLLLCAFSSVSEAHSRTIVDAAHESMPGHRPRIVLPPSGQTGSRGILG
jgi:hypothetical protein